MKVWISRIAVFTVVALLLTGCQTGYFDRFQRSGRNDLPVLDDTDTLAPALPEPGLQLSSEHRFPDVPLPQGVNENQERTFVFQSRDLQIGRMVYSTRASVSELAQFYIRELPATDWRLRDVIEAEGADLMFTKPGKRLKVSIRDLGIGRGRELVLTLTPEAEGSINSSRQGSISSSPL